MIATPRQDHAKTTTTTTSHGRFRIVRDLAALDGAAYIELMGGLYARTRGRI